MAGTEKTGFGASFGTLFEGAVWVLTPFEDTPQEDIDTAKEVIEQMGAHIVIADAKEHDKAVALISHFPLLVSQALFYCIKDNELANNILKAISLSLINSFFNTFPVSLIVFTIFHTLFLYHIFLIQYYLF